MRLKRTRNVILAAGTVGILLTVAPTSASAAPATGPGTMTVGPTEVSTSSTGNGLTFTYTAALAGVSRGALKLVVPAGWSAPQKKKSNNAGFVTSSAGKLSIAKSTISVKKLTLCGSCTFTVKYIDATAPASAVISTFATAAAAKGKRTLPLVSSPTVSVSSSSLTPAAPTVTDTEGGTGSLTVYFTAPSSPETITGYTAACGSSSATVGSPATSVTVPGLSASFLYHCTLYATDAAGNGATAAFSGYAGNSQ